MLAILRKIAQSIWLIQTPYFSIQQQIQKLKPQLSILNLKDKMKTIIASNVPIFPTIPILILKFCRHIINEKTFMLLLSLLYLPSPSDQLLSQLILLPLNTSSYKIPMLDHLYKRTNPNLI